MKINIGIPKAQREEIATGLSKLLADSYTLYLKTHNFHWNVTGPMFNTLHLLFEEEYTELATAVDEIAERIRALGVTAPGSYIQFQELSSIKEELGSPDAENMIRQLVEGQEAVVRTARSIFPVVEKSQDEPTADLLTQRMQVHEKNAWMLRSLLENKPGIKKNNMIFSGKTLLLLGACLYGVMITTVSRAEDTVTVTKPTQEDYQSLGKANSEYNNCLTGQAQQRLDEYSDPRQLASFAMGECAYVLEETSSQPDGTWDIQNRQRPVVCATLTIVLPTGFLAN